MTDDRFTSSDLEASYQRGRRDVAEDLMARRKEEQRKGGPKPIRTLADVRKLTTEECISRRAEVDAVLGAQR